MPILAFESIVQTILRGFLLELREDIFIDETVEDNGNQAPQNDIETGPHTRAGLKKGSRWLCSSENLKNVCVRRWQSRSYHS